jgi:hypothetical protein
MGARGAAWGRRIAGLACARTDRPERRRGTLSGLFVLAMPLAACAAPASYMGVSFTPGAADPHIQTLARNARAGDKHAQLALGIAYEEGRGVGANPKRARKLYRAAATDSGGTIYVYVPATRKGGRGYVMPVDMGPRVAGLAEASHQLDVSISRACQIKALGRKNCFSADKVLSGKNWPNEDLIRRSYLGWANYNCAILIDVCTDADYVQDSSVRVFDVICKDGSRRQAVCQFSVSLSGKRTIDCRGNFNLEKANDAFVWAVAKVDPKVRPSQPAISC